MKGEVARAGPGGFQHLAQVWILSHILTEQFPVGQCPDHHVRFKDQHLGGEEQHSKRLKAAVHEIEK